jgi:hypothetical protein
VLKILGKCSNLSNSRFQSLSSDLYFERDRHVSMNYGKISGLPPIVVNQRFTSWCPEGWMYLFFCTTSLVEKRRVTRKQFGLKERNYHFEGML